MHRMSSTNNSGSRSGITTANNSNRPSKTSNKEEKLSNNDSQIFEKASHILSNLPIKENAYELPPRPNVTFCNAKQVNEEEYEE